MSDTSSKAIDPKDRKCHFCENKLFYIDYKNIVLLKKFTNYFAKIKPRYYTGTCLKHQRDLASAVKKARIMALIPFYR